MKYRHFSAEFKRKVVEEHLHGGRSVTEICREYRIGRNVFYRWRDRYQMVAGGEEYPVQELKRQLHEAQREIEDLQAALGRSTMEVDFLRQAFKRAGLPFPTGPKA